MRKMIVSLSVIALVVALAIPAMAAVNVDNNKTTPVAAGITIDSWNNKGTKEVTVTILDGAAEGSLTVFYGNAKPQAFMTFDTTVATEWKVNVPQGGVSYDWVSFWNRGVVVAPTCTLEGYTYDEYTPTGEKWFRDYTDPLGHQFGDWADLDFSQPRLDVVSNYNGATIIDPVGTCSVCGWSGYLYANITAEEIFVPTCTTHGLIEYTATLIAWSGFSADYNYILGIWSNPLGHTSVFKGTAAGYNGVFEDETSEYTNYQAATCSTGETWVRGWEECEVCGEFILAHFFGYGAAALGHTWESVTWDGSGWLAVCEVCGWQGYIVCGQDGFQCGECEECNPALFTPNADGSITINVSGNYTPADFPALARNRAWNTVNRPIEDGRGWTGGYLEAGATLFMVHNQNQN